MTSTIQISPIGHVHSDRIDPIDDNWDTVVSHIELDASRFDADALAELDSFSHVEVIYYFHRVREEKIINGARHPRSRTDWPKAGIFAQRGKNRPNRIGATICRIIDVDGLTIKISGLDAIDETPVLDLKPVMTEFLPRGRLIQPRWVNEVMANYW